MRPILITPAIMSLAEGYAKNMDKGQDLAKKPLDNLMQLKMDVANPKTIIRFSKKHQNQGGQPKSIFKGNERTEFSKYIEYIIEHYNSINSKHPKDYDELAEEMEKIVPQEDLSTIIQIGKKKTFVSFANRIVIAMDYEGVRDKVFRKFINDPQLNIKTCVYCNAQFAITTLLSPAITEEDIRNMVLLMNLTIISRNQNFHIYVQISLICNRFVLHVIGTRAIQVILIIVCTIGMALTPSHFTLN